MTAADGRSVTSVSPARAHARAAPSRWRRRWHGWRPGLLLVLGVLAVAALQTHSLWDYRGDRVDESELVHFAVGFLGRDLDPGWYGYGSLGMYLLFVVYALLAVPALTVGPYDSVSHYAQLLFSSGYFVVVARYVFAVLGVVTVALYADIARRALRLPRGLVVAYVVVAVTSVDAIHYANYLRSDRLVSFFVALTLWATLRSERPRWLYATAVAAAAAIASKLSALPLAAYVLGLAAHRWRRGEATGEQVALSVLLFGGALVAFQPFVPYAGRIASLLGRGADPPFRLGAARYSSVTGRVAALAGYLATYLGVPVLALLAGLGAARAQRAWRRVVIPALALLALLVLPYVTSAELRPYWFLPVIDLLRFLALVGAGGLWLWARARGWTSPAALAGRPRLRVAVAAALVLVMAAPGLRHAAEVVHLYATTDDGNRELAQAWIEDHLLGREPVRLDVEYGYLLPRVYDPQALYTSKVISRAFVFDRWDHDYLNAVFARYLVRDYGPRNGLGDTFARLRGLRMDVDRDRDARLELAGLRLCNRDGDCRPVTDPPRTNDLAVERLDAGDVAARVTGEDPYLVPFDDLAVPLDGSHTLEFTAVQPTTVEGSVYLDVGEGFTERLKVNFDGTRAVSIRLQAAGPAVERTLVGRLAPFDIGDRGFDERDRGSYFVTSPGSYRTFLSASPADLPPERRSRLTTIQAGYRKLLDQPLVRRFSAGSGQPIEIYRIDG